MTESSRYLAPGAAIEKLHLASSHHQRGEWRQAERLYRDLTTSHPAFAAGWHGYGLLLADFGAFKPALEFLAKATHLDPTNVDFLAKYAEALYTSGHFQEAESLLRQALRRHPKHDALWIQWALLLSRQDRGDEALTRLRPIVERRSGDAFLWQLLGLCYQQGARYDSALRAYARAAELTTSENPAPWLRQASLLRDLARHDEARAVLEVAKTHSPNSAKVWYGIANLDAEASNFEAARKQCRQALTLDQSCYDAWYLLAETTRIGDPHDPLLAELKQAAEQSRSDPRAYPLLFGLGRLWEQVREYDAAFKSYQEANRLRRQSLHYEPGKQQAFTENIINHLDADFIKKAPHISESEDPSAPQPIFIIGMPRSGTTLTESILAAHPEVQGGGEILYIHQQLRRQLSMPQMTQVGTWLKSRKRAELIKLKQDWRRELIRRAKGAAYITDKLPANFTLLGLIHICFPDAPIIHVQRDPLDTCVSCFCLSFANSMNYTFDLAELGHYYRLYDQLMHHWQRLLPPNRITAVRYESLVHSPENEAKRLVEACRLPWDPACLDFHHQKRRVATASLYQVRQPVYTGSVGRWKRFEKHLAPLRDALEGRYNPAV